MAELRERDAMMCRACGKEERASEGYPCSGCGRFICNMCNMRGVTRCADCAAKDAAAAPVKAPAGSAPTGSAPTGTGTSSTGA